MKTKVTLSLTECKHLFLRMHQVQTGTIHMEQIDFVYYTHRLELEKIYLKLQRRITTTRRKFSIAFTPAEILALNFFAGELVTGESAPLLQIVMDKIFQSANDSLENNIRWLKYFVAQGH